MKTKLCFVSFLCLLCMTASLLCSCQMIADSWEIVRLKGEIKTVTAPLTDPGTGIGLSVDLNFTDGGANQITVLPVPDGAEPYYEMTYPSDLEEWGLSTAEAEGVFSVGVVPYSQRQFTADAFSLTVYANVTSYELTGSYTLKADRGGMQTSVLKLHITGGAAVQMTDIAADAVSVHVDGAADVVLSGTCGKLDAQINGAGVLESAALTAQNGAVTVNGVGAASVCCTETLEVEINGAGTVQYKGEPELTKTINGLGTVTQIPDETT